MYAEPAGAQSADLHRRGYSPPNKHLWLKKMIHENI